MSNENPKLRPKFVAEFDLFDDRSIRLEAKSTVTLEACRFQRLTVGCNV
jgi:hypothetical protein